MRERTNVRRTRRPDFEGEWSSRLGARRARLRARWATVGAFVLSSAVGYGAVYAAFGLRSAPADPAPSQWALEDEADIAVSSERSVSSTLDSTLPPVVPLPETGWVAMGGNEPEARLAIEPPLAPEFPVQQPPQTEHTTLEVIKGEVPTGGTVGSSLRALGIDATDVHTIDRSIRPVFDFRHAHAGDSFALIRDNESRLISFEFQRGRRNIYRVERTPEGELSASHRVTPLERRIAQLGGVIDRSLFESIRELGERPELVNDFADIFMWDFDFSRQTRPGDEFRVVFEKFYDRDGFVKYGKLLAAQYSTSNDAFTAVYFEDEQGYGDYYTPDGNSMRRTFLRAPLEYSRISSRYTTSRLHPVTKVRSPHYGVDYAAPRGTEVWAVAEGEIISKGWMGGLGRTIRVKHPNGYISYYGHLSRYAKGLKVGGRVRQKDVIGYVGSSGLSTGPHLDYRVKYEGRFVDPLKLRFPDGEPVQVVARDRFADLASSRIAALNAANPPLVLEAGM